MSPKRLTLIYCLLIVALTACSRKMQRQQSPQPTAVNQQPSNVDSSKVMKPSTKPKYGTEIKTFVSATVVNFKGRDGCDFALQLENGEYLEADKIPAKFQVDGKKVLIKYKYRYDAASICMMGKMVYLTKIKQLD